MLVKCKTLKNKEVPMTAPGLITLLAGGGLITPKGELKEEVRIYLGGPFFDKNDNSPEVKGIPWTFSTFDEDRDEERIDPAGWELAHYRENPVVLWSHDSRIPAIGYAEATGVKDEKLSGRIIFNEKEVDPFGWGVGQRVVAGSLRAGSVGFLIRKVEIREADGEAKIIFRNQELLEFSICNVPSNPFALQEAMTPEATEIPKERTFWHNIIRNA